jgi:hypothetical protein
MPRPQRRPSRSFCGGKRDLSSTSPAASTTCAPASGTRRWGRFSAAGVAGIDAAFQSAQAAQNAAFAADINAFNAGLAAESQPFDLAVQDNEYTRAAKAAAGTQGDPVAALEEINKALKDAGQLVGEVATKIKQAEKFLGAANKNKRRECK